MPTPTNGQISISNIESEFGKLDGNPSSISEYRNGTPNSFGGGGTVFGIRGVPRTGQVAFSDFRNKIARATPQKVINALRVGLNSGIISDVGNSSYTYGLAGVLGAVDNRGGTSVAFTTNFTTSNLDEDVRACEGNTVIYMILGKSSSPTQTVQSMRINGQAISNHVNIIPPNTQNSDYYGDTLYSGQGNANVQGAYVTSTIDTRSGFKPIGDYASFNYSVKSSLAVAHETLGFGNASGAKNPPRALPFVTSAYLATPGGWQGCGGGDCDSQVQAAMFLIPNRWVLKSYARLDAAAPTFTLAPYEIAIVSYAVNYSGNTFTDYPPLPTPVAGSFSFSGLPPTLTRLFTSRQFCRGMSCIVMYANDYESSVTYSLGDSTLFPGFGVVTGGGLGYLPVVYIFSMVSTGFAEGYPGGDGYLSSRRI